MCGFAEYTPILLFWQEGKCLGGEGDELDLPGAENLLSNMETQTQDDLLLCINSCTQTGIGTYSGCDCYLRVCEDISTVCGKSSWGGGKEL
jgi:hypothetical protein